MSPEERTANRASKRRLSTAEWWIREQAKKHALVVEWKAGRKIVVSRN